MSQPKRPWRNVMGYVRIPALSGTDARAYNTLECGHRTGTFVGSAAIDAKHAKRRRCPACGTQSQDQKET
jgi:hypothetical protein